MNQPSFHMSASIRNPDGSKERARIEKADWAHLDERLRSAFQRGGNVSIDREVAGVEFGSAVGCSLRGEPGKYVLMATIFGATGDRVVRWREPEGTPEHGVVDIAGDEWDARSVVTDLSIAIRIFKEVFETGAVSGDSLNHMR